MNYTELVTLIGSYVENTFTTDQYNQFILQAEQRIYNSVQLPDLRKNVTGTVTNANPYINAPTDFLAIHSLAVIDLTGNYSYLLNKDVEYLREAYASPTLTGLPRYYAIFGGRSDNPEYLSYIVAPTPDQSYTVELHYYYYPQSITTSSTGTTWLGDNYDSCLLYGSILEAYVFLKGEPEVIADYKARYDEAMELLKGLGDGKNRQDNYRTTQVRYPVK
jgi:hypothetical protein